MVGSVGHHCGNDLSWRTENSLFLGIQEREKEKNSGERAGIPASRDHYSGLGDSQTKAPAAMDWRPVEKMP